MTRLMMVVSLGLASVATAQEADFSALAALPMPKAETGVETAKPAEPTWCATVEASSGSPGGLKRTIEAGTRDWRSFITALPLTCQWPKEPAVQRAVAIITQNWMNYTGLTQARALEVLGLRAQSEKFEADKKRLCEQLAIPAETEGEDKLFMQARRKLFGCEAEALWLSGESLGGTRFSNPIASFLDASATPPDQAVLLANVIGGTRFLFEDEKGSGFDLSLLRYVVDQVDLALISEAKTLAMLDAAPYQGNDAARAVLLESVSRVKLAEKLYKNVVDARQKDAAWKELLVTAPARGLAEWNKVAAQNQEALSRSNAFEAKFFGPSRSAVKGCWATLKPDFVKVLKGLPHATEFEVQASLNEPIAALLLSRLAACAAVELDPAYANRLVAIAREVRPARGQRSAAYFSALSALGPILADRPKFPIEARDLVYGGDVEILDAASSLVAEKMGTSKLDVMGWAGDGGEGTVQSVKKAGANAVVTFVSTKGQVMSHSCQTTNRISRISSSGDIVYERICRETGWVTVDTTPGAFTAPVEWVEGVQAGSVVKFEATRGKPPTRFGLPIASTADKSKKRLTNFLGLGL